MDNAGTSTPASPDAPPTRIVWLALGGLLVTLIWGYWNSLAEAALSWERLQYSHGWLVPLFTLAVMWMRYEPYTAFPDRQRWWGAGLLASGLLARVYAAHIGVDVLDMWTFVPCVAGLVLMVGGWPMFRWAGPAVLLLIFMFPLPWSLERAVLAPLQRLATEASTYVLQTLGVGAYSEGNRICIDRLQMGVVDACSGLSMTTTFLAMSLAIVLVAHRAWWENLLILLSAVPIALTVNVIRITLTGILYLTTTAEFADVVFHQWLAPYAMTLLAFVFLWLELVILSRLFCEVECEDSLPIWEKVR